MKDQAAVVHLPATLTSKWSLSSRDKKRLKQILVLCALIIALLWLLFQLAQMTIPTGAGGVRGIHVDGDTKSSVHVEPVGLHPSSVGGAWKRKTIIGAPALGSHSLGGSAQGPDLAGNNDANAATGSNYGNQGGYPLAGGAGTPPGAGTQQQESPGFGSGNTPFFGFGNPALFFNNGGGVEGSQSSGAGGSSSGANSGGNGSNGNGGNPANGQGNGPGTSSNGGGSSPFVGDGNPGSGGGGSSGNPTGGSTPGPNGNDGGNSGGHDVSGDGPGNGPGNGTGGGAGDGSGNGSGNGQGNGSGAGAGDGSPNSDGPPLFGDGDGGGSSGGPGTDLITGSGGNGPDILAPTVEVPEPNSTALFAGGFLALLVILRRQRRHRIDPAQATTKACRMSLAALTWTALLALMADQASAETATVYGTTASIFSPHSGAFLPANTNLACFSMNEANCWDGKIWHHLYPSGRRHYAVADTDRVACSVILAPSNDCWTGSAWYRLPKGQLFGVIGGFFSNTPGAFITVPLRWQPVTYSSTTAPSPLGEFASKR